MQQNNKKKLGKNPPHRLHGALFTLLVPLLLAPLLAHAGGAAAAGNQVELNLMPYPSQVERLPGLLTLSEKLSIRVRGPEFSETSAALERFTRRLQRQTGIALQSDDENTDGRGAQLVVEWLPDAYKPEEVIGKLIPDHEAYELHIGENAIHIRIRSHLGLIRGLETLLQLIGTARSQQIALPALAIHDVPRFRWRGLLIDSVRHFFSVDTIKRQLDGMSAAKLNVFHWHLTDDQGWRLESSSYPKLHQLASNGLYYTREQVREVVAYAHALGIEVMPEIDMPGHSSAIGVAYPELMSAPGPYKMEDRWGVHRPLLNPANEQVYEFAEKILGEVAELFPFGYVHIGGDEIDPHDWIHSPQIREFMRNKQLQTAQDLHNYFNARIAQILKKYRRNMVGWDEVLHPALAPDTVVQSWRGPDSLGEITRAGYPALLSTGFYLDQPQTSAYHYRNRLLPSPLELDQQAAPGEHWQSWEFSLPRKRGSAVTGSFTLIDNTRTGMRGFIDFSGKSRRTLQNIDIRHGTTYFQLDTWMGPLQARLDLSGEQLVGDMLIGNVAYPAVGKSIGSSRDDNARIPQAPVPGAIDPQQQHRIFGGEAALWSEMVDESSIDLRLWPRAFVVAERLWSPQKMRDEDFLYRRLSAISTWAAESAGLRHRQQQLDALAKLLPESQRTPALTLSEALEPAHYYHRHHEKSAHASYSRRDPLNLFADSLPAESIAVRELAQDINHWLEQPREIGRLYNVRETLVRWRDSAVELNKLISEARDPGDLQILASRVQHNSTLAIQLIDRLELGQNPDMEAAAALRTSLREAQQMHGEVVMAAAYPLERLLDASYQ